MAVGFRLGTGLTTIISLRLRFPFAYPQFR